jgi:predicted DNA binding protein
VVDPTLFDVTFKIQHDCPYTRFSMKHPEIRIVEWCNNKIHAMEIECPDIETFTRIEKDLNELLLWKGGKVLKKSFLKGDLQLIIKTCRCGKLSSNVADVIEGNSALLMMPEVYFVGWEEYRVIGFRDSDYKRLFEGLGELGPVEVLSKRIANERGLRDTFAISLSNVFSDLTEKQLSSLMLALDFGYYEIPKKMTAEQIAGKQKVPRTTYEEHLRKAESKILQAIAPYVRMFGSKLEPIERAPEIRAK